MSDRKTMVFTLNLGTLALFVTTLVGTSARNFFSTPARGQDSSFSLEEGRMMVTYAAASYCSPDVLRNWTCERCSDSVAGFVPKTVVTDEDWDLQAVVGYSPQLSSALVIFRGTKGSSWENWIHNLMTTKSQVRHPGMPKDATVHDGFWRSWTRSNLQNRTSVALDALFEERGVLPVVVVGHSLGGALATLCAADLLTERNLTAVRLYTFGCPRVGNYAFASAMRNTTLDNTRVTHDRDIVPTVPFTHFGFHHLAREVWQRTITTGSKKHPPRLNFTMEITCDGSGEDRRCQDSLCRYLGACTSIEDHLEYLGVPLGGGNGHEC